MPEVHSIVVTSEPSASATAKKRGRPKKVVEHDSRRDTVMLITTKDFSVHVFNSINSEVLSKLFEVISDEHCCFYKSRLCVHCLRVY